MSTLPIDPQFRWTTEEWAAAEAWWKADLSRLGYYELLAELEYCTRRLAEIRAIPDLGAGLLDGIEWDRTMAGRVAWLQVETERRAPTTHATTLAPRRITSEFAQDLKRRLELHVFLCARFGVCGKGSGATIMAQCPFHDDATPSFAVWPAEHRWHCFGRCNTGGDVYDFLLVAPSVRSWTAAVEYVADYLGVPLPARTQPEAPPAYRVLGATVPEL